MMLDVRDRLVWTRVGLAVLATCGLTPLLAGSAPVLSADGLTAYDAVNNVTWLADANLAASNRFGLPVCHGSSIDMKTCVNQSGSMSYQAAAAWVAAMNAANYLGHTNWQLPTTPTVDSGCQFTDNGNSVGFKCSRGALGYLYYSALGLTAPNTAVSIPNNVVGPFKNFQPYLYWSQSDSRRIPGRGSFSFNSGFQSSNFDSNFLYVFPMIQGKIPGTPAATGNGLQVNPDGRTVYDPLTNITWLANANLAATNTFGLPICLNSITSKPCVNQDGSMNFGSANQFVVNMHSAAYLGQTDWNLPPLDPSCEGAYVCAALNAPFQGLFYSQLGLSPGTPVIATPDSAVGPFHHLQPYLYWSCVAATIQDACQTDGPAPGFEFSFSFGNGYLDTDAPVNDLYVTAYFVGSRTSTTGPTIAYVANAEGESPMIAPNTWIEIKGVTLAPAGDTRIWQGSDFVGNQMPTQLDQVSVTVNGKNAFVYYISPTQINALTPPDAMSGPVQVVVTNGATASAAFIAQAQPISPSFFVFDGTYVAAEHPDYSFVGPVSLYPGLSTPAKPGEIVSLYANGFGPTSAPVVSGSVTQSGSLPAPPVIKIGGANAIVQYYSLVAPGEFLFNVVVPASLADGDQPITATYNGSATQPGTLITIQH